jgi:hypothetical protein
MVNKTRFFGVFSGIGLRTCGQRIRYRDEHGRIFAGRILGLVVFRSHVAALLMQLDKREFPGPGDAVSLNVLNRDAFHGGRHSQILNASRNPAKPGLEFAVTDIRGPGGFWQQIRTERGTSEYVHSPNNLRSLRVERDRNTPRHTPNTWKANRVEETA